MQVINSPAQARDAFSRCVATIGKYDGMHLGHQHILDQVLANARSAGQPAVVVLSEPQPEEFFAGENAPPRLNHLQDKVDFLAGYDIDLVYLLTFDQALSQLSAEDFVRHFLVNTLGLSKLVIGDDFRFGKNRGGDIALLNSMGKVLDFCVTAVADCMIGGERVSSTLVRQYLAAGNCAHAARLLGRPYSISGTIVQGKQLGRQIGVPTANVELLTPGLPMTGVFAVKAALPGVTSAPVELDGVANLGYKPTVTTERRPSLEVHLLDFDHDIYGQKMRVNFLHKLRDETKFDSLAALQAQIERDIVEARAHLASRQEAELL